MRRCPECGREYDLTMSFCLDDGAELLYGPAKSEPPGSAGGRFDEPQTAILHVTDAVGDAPTRAQIHTTEKTAILPSGVADVVKAKGIDKRLLLAPLALAVIILGGFFGYRYFSPAKQINSIAVMPFENRNSDDDTDYLSDGLAESLIFRLTQIPDLKVSPTSSVMRYKGKETDVAKIAGELGVDAVMTGRLTKRGDNLNITVELVDARTNKSLWGEQYERKLSELLTTQREMVSEIVSKLQLKLSGESEQRLAKKYTANDEAYQLYLRGRFHWSKRTDDEYRKAVDAYRRAIALDPNFALAYVGIADIYNSMGKDPVVAPKDCVPLAKDAAMQALKIDPTLAEAHAALADSVAIFDWDWSLSEAEFKRARELDPNVSYIHLASSSSYFAPMKRADEMLAEMNRALELEPLSLINNSVMVTGYLYARQNDKALQQARKAHDLDPNFRIAYHWLGLAYIANNMYDDAVKLGDEGLQKWPNNPEMLFVVGQACAKSGRRDQAEQYIGKIRDVSKSQYVRTYWLACIYAALDDKDKAFAELERSYQDKDCFLPRANIDPAMDPLRNDARFKDLMKRMGLPE
ncbi:MAG: TPR end-of-group domain-containing protein [Pyrinomonadaceae bacterium]